MVQLGQVHSSGQVTAQFSGQLHGSVGVTAWLSQGNHVVQFGVTVWFSQGNCSSIWVAAQFS